MLLSRFSPIVSPKNESGEFSVRGCAEKVLADLETRLRGQNIACVYYNLLRESGEQQKGGSTFRTELSMLISGSLFISTITKIEIVSVLGKYARGSSGGFQRCTRCISEAGESCQNQWYTAPRVRWYRREIGGVAAVS